MKFVSEKNGRYNYVNATASFLHNYYPWLWCYINIITNYKYLSSMPDDCGGKAFYKEAWKT